MRDFMDDRVGRPKNWSQCPYPRCDHVSRSQTEQHHHGQFHGK